MLKNTKKAPAIYFLLLSILLALPLTAHGSTGSPTTPNRYQASSQQTATKQAEPETTKKTDEPRELSMFFKIGIGLNIVMLALYIFWATRQWRQSGRHED